MADEKPKNNPSVRQVIEVAIFPQLDGIEKTGVWRWRSNCPSHNDKRGCLSISVTDGNLDLVCGHGCTLRAVCEALGISGATRTAIFPHKHATLFWQDQDYLASNPQALLDHYREALKAGVKLSTADKAEFRDLAAKMARKAA